MGFGHALFEETIYQDGQFQNGDPFQYRLPVMQDIPEKFYSSMLEKGDGPGPFGSEGHGANFDRHGRAGHRQRGL